MKALYIIPFLFFSVTFYAQENDKKEVQDQELVLKEAQENAKKMQAEDKSVSKEKQNVLASEQGFQQKQNAQKAEKQNNNQGKLLPNTASLEEISASIPNRQSSKKANIAAATTKVQGLTNTATLQEIKKTIPKN